MTAVLVDVLPGTTTTTTSPGRRAPLPRRFAYLVLGALALDTNLMVLLDVSFGWVSVAAALATVIGIPTFLLYAANPARMARGSERLAVSVVITLGLLMVAGLVANTLGPFLSVDRPLGADAVVVVVDVTIVVLGIWAWPRQPASYTIPSLRVGVFELGALLGGASAFGLAVLGATRLNNRGGGGTALAALGVVLASFGALLVWRHRIRPGAVAATIYLLGGAVLLMTSLRGWDTTGHDIQRELQVFELTKVLGYWDMSRYQDGYNACLSITILPTILARWTRVSDPYVFKLFFQLLFALCPVLVYHLARRFVSGGLALLATVYFVAFPTFLQDMPFLNRQEIALLFLTAGLLCLFNPQAGPRRGKVWFCVLAVGMVLSHYSTTYVAIAVLLTAAGLRIVVPRLWALGGSAGPLTRRLGWLVRPPARPTALGLGTIAFVIAVSLLWTGPSTGTSGGFTRMVSSVAEGLSGRHPGSKSSDTAYSLFSTAKPSPARLLDQYRQETEAANAADPVTFYDAATLARHPTPVVDRPLLPATPVGSQLQRLGLDLPAVNSAIRQGTARILQLFIALGLLVVVFARRRSVVASADLLYLAAANLFVLFLQVVLPALSVEYGLLRTFQQSLLVLDVFLVAGSLALVPRRLGRWRNVIGAGMALGFLASSTGLVTQLLGGYEAQLHLNRSGQYFDIYYRHPEELAAASWIRGNVDTAAAGGIQSAVQTDAFTFPALQSLEVPANGNDIFPPLVRRDAYVFLGYANVLKGQSTASYAGDLLTYRYPLELLDAEKDLLYSTAGSRVYR